MQPDPVSNSFGVSHSSAEFGTDHWTSKLIPLRPLNFACRLVLGWGEYLSEFTSERHSNLIQKHRKRSVYLSLGSLFQSSANDIVRLFWIHLSLPFPYCFLLCFSRLDKKSGLALLTLLELFAVVLISCYFVSFPSVCQHPLKIEWNMDVAHSSTSRPRKIPYLFYFILFYLKNPLFIGIQCIKQEYQNKNSFLQFHREIN